MLCVVAWLSVGSLRSVAVASNSAAIPVSLPLAGPRSIDPVPKIATLVKASVYKQALENREVMTHAVLEDLPEVPAKPPFKVPVQPKKYSIYALMLVNARPIRTFQIMTNFSLYPKMISYIEKAELVDAKQNLVKILGGIWNFKLQSLVKFEEKNKNWIHYQVIGGHFAGLTGDMYFESMGENGTLVYLNGSVTGVKWPPTFVIERGAEIVFGFTGKRMRTYIESSPGDSKAHAEQDAQHPNLPQPRSHLE